VFVEVLSESPPGFVFRLLQAFQNAPDGLANAPDLLLLARLRAAHVLQRPGFDFGQLGLGLVSLGGVAVRVVKYALPLLLCLALALEGLGVVGGQVVFALGAALP